MKDAGVNPGSGSLGDPGSTATSLLERVKRQEPDAWQRLVTLYGPLIYGWARRARASPEDAADVVQEVFRAVVEHVGEFRRDRPGDTFRGWLWTITQNKLRDQWRRRVGRAEATGGTDAQERLQEVPAEPESTSGASVSAAPPGSLLRRALDLIRAEFEERTWRAFWGVVVEGKAPAEVATDLGMSANAVYVARSRVLRRLREEMGDEG